MGILWYSDGISIGFPWDFYGISKSVGQVTFGHVGIVLHQDQADTGANHGLGDGRPWCLGKKGAVRILSGDVAL
jgi:hypothetical protein